MVDVEKGERQLGGEGQKLLFVHVKYPKSSCHHVGCSNRIIKQQDTIFKALRVSKIPQKEYSQKKVQGYSPRPTAFRRWVENDKAAEETEDWAVHGAAPNLTSLQGLAWSSLSVLIQPCAQRPWLHMHGSWLKMGQQRLCA